MLEVGPNEMRDMVFKKYVSSRLEKIAPDPILFLGPSGVGKTASIRAAAQAIVRETGEEFIDYTDYSRLNETERSDLLRNIEAQGRRPFFFVEVSLLSHEPSDFSGLPREGKVLDTRVTKFIPMEWTLLLTRYPGMVFIDEITNINREDIRGVAYKITDERRTGSVVLSPEVQIIAAGNRPEDSSAALPLPKPLLNRLEVYNAKAPAAEDWYKYASEKWPRADSFLLGYLSKIAASPEVPEEAETLRQFATPRKCEAVLRREISYRTFSRQEVSVSDMNEIAVGNLGSKEGELLTGWWSRRKEIVEFLGSEHNAEGKKNLSPAALWAVGIYVGRVINNTYNSSDQKNAYGPVGMDAAIDRNMGQILKNISKNGKEYLVPIYLGMDAFTKGSDPRQSAAKVAYATSRMTVSESDELQMRKDKKRCPELVRNMAAFQSATPVEYFNGGLAKALTALAANKQDKEAQSFVSVGERLLADQVSETLGKLMKMKEARQPLAEVVGNNFAEQIAKFNAGANWQKVLAGDQWESGPVAGKKQGKTKLMTELVAQAAERQGVAHRV